MKTETTKVTKKVQIWAIPTTLPLIGDEEPFYYEIKTSSPYQDGSVMVHEEEIILYVPAGVDLLSAAVDTLKAEIQTTRATAEARCVNLQEQINNLLMIEYKPEASDEYA